MNVTAPDLARRAAAMRLAFDRTFAAPVRIATAIHHDLLAVRLGADPYALRLAEVGGLFADRKITRVPGSAAALLGIAGFRGALMPVYSLRTLLGSNSTQMPRWLLVAAHAPLALAFDSFDGHLRVTADTIHPDQQKQARRFVPEFVRVGDLVRPIIHLPSVVAALGTTTEAPGKRE